MFFLNKFRFHSWAQTSGYLLFTLYLSAVWALVGLPSVSYLRFGLNLNLIPFAGIIADLKNSVLNVLLFVPMGFLLPLLWTKFHNARQTVLFGLCVSGIIEVLQILTLRATDINDLITNTLGTGIGWLLSALLLKKLPEASKTQNTKELWILLICVFAVMFFAQPFLSNAIWSLIY